jgi:hypothetical protein
MAVPETVTISSILQADIAKCKLLRAENVVLSKEKESVQKEDSPGAIVGEYVLGKVHQHMEVQRRAGQFGHVNTQRIETNVMESWIDFAFPVR